MPSAVQHETQELKPPAQVREVRGREVVCMAQNDAMLGGLLTVIHSELNESGMSSLQARRPRRSSSDPAVTWV